MIVIVWCFYFVCFIKVLAFIFSVLFVQVGKMVVNDVFLFAYVARNGVSRIFPHTVQDDDLMTCQYQRGLALGI